MIYQKREQLFEIKSSHFKVINIKMDFEAATGFELTSAL
jgi:hypothetical protein